LLGEFLDAERRPSSRIIAILGSSSKCMDPVP
jgi:hypothetical protein